MKIGVAAKMANELFSRVDPKLGALISKIETGELGLPDLQRPFVWRNTKVRDLFDSMMKGFPIGFLLLWDTPDSELSSKQIGTGQHMYASPKQLIIDGQQRLTSLYAAIKGKSVLDLKYRERKIIIAFNPLTCEFEVELNKNKKNPEWVSDISVISQQESWKYINSFTDALKAARASFGGTLTGEEENTAGDNIAKLYSLLEYQMPALEISKDADEEAVAEIFKRVNSGGVKLNENNFILTLISVFWDEGRTLIEQFCADSTVPTAVPASYNQLIELSPSHIIRAVTGYGFKRARLKYAYMMLRGKDLKSGAVTNATRDENFGILKAKLAQVLKLSTWHEFLKCIMAAGFISRKLISSDNAVIYCYVMYLIGKHDYNVEHGRLRKIIAKWFYMASVTGRYTNSPESQMEQDLADMRGIENADEFERFFEQKLQGVFTDDYFNSTLVEGFETSSANSPAWNAYNSALVLLNEKVLFSELYIPQLLTSSSTSTKSALEKHHLFPVAYLKRLGVTATRDINQVANYAFIEWNDNIDILDENPKVYFDPLVEKLGADKENRMKNHALPEGWTDLSYGDFLIQRRRLMAQVVKRGYETI